DEHGRRCGVRQPPRRRDRARVDPGPLDAHARRDGGPRRRGSRDRRHRRVREAPRAGRLVRALTHLVSDTERPFGVWHRFAIWCLAPKGRLVPGTAAAATLADMTRTVIVSAVRTPFGRLGGGLKGYGATELGAIAIRAALERAGLEGGEVDYVM